MSTCKGDIGRRNRMRAQVLITFRMKSFMVITGIFF
jgi:hypothetical protein